MRFFRLTWSALTRKPARTAFTAVSLLAVFVLVGLAMALRHGFSSSADLPGKGVVIVFAKGNTQLPLAYRGKLEQMSGVSDVMPVVIAPFYYQNIKNTTAMEGLDPDLFLQMFGRLVKVGQGSLNRWRHDRSGIMVSAKTAKKYGWKVGQRLTFTPMPGSVPPGKDSITTTLDTILTSQSTFGGEVQAHFDYLKTWLNASTVPVVVVRAHDANDAPALATRVKAAFKNSPVPVGTQVLQAVFQNILQRAGDVGTITLTVIAAAIFSVLLIIGNTVTQSVAERRGEFAVLEALGFRPKRLRRLVLAEAALLIAGAGLPGLALSWLLINTVGASFLNIMPGFSLSFGGLLLGVALIIVLTLLATAPGCVIIARLEPAQSLRKA